MKSKANFILILLARGISSFGDILFDLFMAWIVADISNSVMSSVYVIGSSFIFRSILSVFSGTISDLVDRKKLTIYSNVFSALTIFIGFILVDIYPDEIWLYICLVLVNDIFNELFAKSYMTFTSDIFETDVYIKLQSLTSILIRVITIGGSAIVGFLIAYINASSIMIIDVISFLVAAILISFVKQTKVRNSNGVAKNNVKVNKKHTNIQDYFKFIRNNVLSSKFIITFIIIMFILNLAYGYIPYILPIVVAKENNSAGFLGLIKSGIAIGEIIGLTISMKYSKNISNLFITGLMGSMLSIFSILFLRKFSIGVITVFLAYGLFDSLTQPFFSYTISQIESSIRGRVLGFIDCVILLSPSIGMWLGTKIYEYNSRMSILFICLVFIIALIIYAFSYKTKYISIDKEAENNV